MGLWRLGEGGAQLFDADILPLGGFRAVGAPAATSFLYPECTAPDTDCERWHVDDSLHEVTSGIRRLRTQELPWMGTRRGAPLSKSILPPHISSKLADAERLLQQVQDRLQRRMAAPGTSDTAAPPGQLQQPAVPGGQPSSMSDSDLFRTNPLAYVAGVPSRDISVLDEGLRNVKQAEKMLADLDWQAHAGGLDYGERHRAGLALAGLREWAEDASRAAKKCCVEPVPPPRMPGRRRLPPPGGFQKALF